MVLNVVIATQMILGIEQLLNLPLTFFSVIVQEKYVLFETCLHFKVVTKGNLPKVAFERNGFGCNGR